MLFLFRCQGSRFCLLLLSVFLNVLQLACQNSAQEEGWGQFFLRKVVGGFVTPCPWALPRVGPLSQGWAFCRQRH